MAVEANLGPLWSFLPGGYHHSGNYPMPAPASDRELRCRIQDQNHFDTAYQAMKASVDRVARGIDGQVAEFHYM